MSCPSSGKAAAACGGKKRGVFSIQGDLSILVLDLADDRPPALGA